MVICVCSCTSSKQKVDPSAIMSVMKQDIETLASDEMEGRETGTPGEALAAEYIIKRMKEIGLEPAGDSTTYKQRFSKQIKSNPHADVPAEDDPIIVGYNVVGHIDHGAAHTIVLGAHYDHLGYGGEGSLHTGDKEVHNGADDNASGVASILYMADRLKDDQYADHNYLIIAFSGEEKGLWGSNYFAKNHTLSDGEINMMVNLDMVGRLNEERQIAIHGVGTSPGFSDLIDHENTYELKVNKEESGIGPSDHTSFYLEEIPVLSFFTGQHEHYHKPGDDAHLINYNGLYDLSHFVLDIVDEINEELPFTKTKDESQETPDFKVTLGVIPDYLYSDKGMRIDGTRDGRPAANAGMIKGDIVVQMGDLEIVDMMTYMKALGAFEPDTTVQVTFIRDGVKMTKPVTFD